MPVESRYICHTFAWVAELVDARDLKSLGACTVRVRFSSQAFREINGLAG